MSCQELTVNLQEVAKPQAGEMCRRYSFPIAGDTNNIQSFAGDNLVTFGTIDNVTTF